jgi:hypothetical protein
MYSGYSPSQDAHAVEYLIETDANETQGIEEGDEDEQHDEMFETQNTQDDDEQIQEEEITTQAIAQINEKESGEIKFTYTQPEEIAYQEAFVSVNETSLNANTIELDSWLANIKETLLSLPKLYRARAKKQINELVSEFEINYLESIDSTNV